MRVIRPQPAPAQPAGASVVLVVEVVAAEPEFAAVVVVDPSAPVVVGASVVVVDSVVVVALARLRDARLVAVVAAPGNDHRGGEHRRNESRAPS